VSLGMAHTFREFFLVVFCFFPSLSLQSFFFPGGFLRISPWSITGPFFPPLLGCFSHRISSRVLAPSFPSSLPPSPSRTSPTSLPLFGADALFAVAAFQNPLPSQGDDRAALGVESFPADRSRTQSSSPPISLPHPLSSRSSLLMRSSFPLSWRKTPFLDS